MQKIDSSLLKAIVPIHKLPPTDNKFLVFRLEHARCPMTLVGTEHAREHEAEQVAALRDELARWMEGDLSDRGVCLERICTDYASHANEREAVEKCGEPGLIGKTLDGTGVSPVVVEPDFNKVVIPLTREILSDDLALGSWAVLNFLASTCRKGEYTEAAAKNLSSVANSVSDQFSIKGGHESIWRHVMKETGVRLPGIDADPGAAIDLEAIKKAQEPGDGPYSTNRAGAALNLARDYGMLQNILAESKERDGLFVWLGLNHALSILPALEHAGYKATRKN